MSVFSGGASCIAAMSANAPRLEVRLESADLKIRTLKGDELLKFSKLLKVPINELQARLSEPGGKGTRYEKYSDRFPGVQDGVIHYVSTAVYVRDPNATPQLWDAYGPTMKRAKSNRQLLAGVAED